MHQVRVREGSKASTKVNNCFHVWAFGFIRQMFWQYPALKCTECNCLKVWDDEAKQWLNTVKTQRGWEILH